MSEFVNAGEIVKAAALEGLKALVTGNAEGKDFAVNAGFMIDAVDRALNAGDVDKAKAFLAGDEDASAYVAAYLDEKYGKDDNLADILGSGF